MITVKFIGASGDQTEISGEPGDTVMHLAVMNGIDGIVGECGGSMMCATCHCHIDADWTGIAGARNDGEDDMLECAATPTDDRSRLSCQVKLTPDMDGLVVHLPESQA